VAVCFWLSPTGDTFFIWEKNGPQGTAFTDEMMLLGYPNVYYSGTGGDEQRHYVQKSDRPGYHNSKLSVALTPLLNALTRNDCTVRSRALLAECGEYEITDTGQTWEHPRSRNARDASARGLSHGDRVVAAAMAMRAIRERPVEKEQPPPLVQQQSLAGRIARAKAAHKKMAMALSRW
jgi:hypothetical protein